MADHEPLTSAGHHAQVRGAGLLTDRQHDQLDALFSTDDHVAVEATWDVYQRMIAAYRDPTGNMVVSRCAS